MNLKNSFFILFMSACASTAQADVPSGYYKSAEGKTGQELLKALHSIVGPHTTVSYDGLWTVYAESDLTEDGKGLWDMYSTKVWAIGKEKCGNYKYVGDCVNREHSFPKSWFDDRKPMYSDAFHLYPTDGKVNGQRSNFPYGECSGGTVLPSHNGYDALGRLGSSTFSGYSGKVFEPDDRYKGDFARSYFYMAAAYNDKFSTFSSDMLAGNSYPAYKSWALNLLLKWHRQDEVSKKETVRNDAVYKHQNNRNPFIDYPELVEYVWGNKVGTPWYPGGTVDPEIISPASGSSLSLGYAPVGTSRSVTITVRGSGLNDNLKASVATSSFSVSPATISAADANKGTTLTVTVTPSAAGHLSDVLTLTSGTLRSTVSLSADAVSGLVAEEPTSVTDGSFVARWVNVSGADAKYDLYVEREGAILNGYPVTVDAKDEFRRVGGLEPETTYTYYVAYNGKVSNRISVTTSAPIPMIQILYDDIFDFTAIAGTPFEPVEILFETENITSDITLTVEAPFEISTDRTNWKNALTLSTEEDRFYLRVNSSVTGEYSTFIRMQAGSYVYDDIEFTASIINRPADFLEDFETENVKDNYTDGDYPGNAAVWYCDNAGVYNGDRDKALNGERSARFGKDATSSLTMKENKQLGIGTFSFITKKWSGDADATVEAEYSTDNGVTWKSAGTATATDAVQTHNYTVNVTGNARVRIRQVSGTRLFVDDISLTDYTSGVSVTTDDFRTWDAYAVGHTLVIENRNDSREFEVYSVDGMLIHSVTVGNAAATRSLSPGLYIVVADDFARKVLVK